MIPPEEKYATEYQVGQISPYFQISPYYPCLQTLQLERLERAHYIQTKHNLHRAKNVLNKTSAAEENYFHDFDEK